MGFQNLAFSALSNYILDITILGGGGGRGKMSKKLAEMSKMSKKKLKCQYTHGNV